MFSLIFLVFINFVLAHGLEYHCQWLCPQLLRNNLAVNNQNYWVDWCQETCKHDPNLPIILAWRSPGKINDPSDPFFPGLAANGTYPDCSYQCSYTEDRRFEEYTTAIVYFTRDTYANDMPTRRSDQFQVFMISELTIYYDEYSATDKNFREELDNLPDDFFNITMTYRNDSDVRVPYEYFTPITKKSKRDDAWTREEVLNAINAKELAVVLFISHCNTNSEREAYIEELRKHINITTYGKCYDKKCERYDQCEEEAIRKHFFVIAFENSICLDYVTEKFWRLEKLIVPIVLDRSLYQNYAPKDMDVFMAASDYSSPKKLAERLKLLIEHKEEYMKYFDWTKKYEKTTVPKPHQEFCDLCEFIHTHPSHQHENWKKWWIDDSNCKPGYAKKLLN